ncbi:fructose 1,6-bisphosphatase [Candidatus Daviesbacteria bacterium]|nr:fructose 1,6-bisphosphatase [Candidatus Daviesbacteria bacterium]
MPGKLSYNHTPIAPYPKPISSFYEQTKDYLANLPQTMLEADTNSKSSMPNIFNVPLQGMDGVWNVKEGIKSMFVITTKADVGGVGGHVEVSLRTQATVLDHVLRHNRYGDENLPIFRSLIVTHTGDDVCITGIVDGDVIKNRQVIDELLWDAFKKGEEVAYIEGLYGPGQDLKADAFSGNIRGLGPASITLPLPVRDMNPSQTVLLATADKTEPGAYNYLTTGAYLNPDYNTGLLIAESSLSKGYIFEIMDLDTKAQAFEEGVAMTDSKKLEAVMEKLGKTERSILLSGPEDYYNIGALTMASSRFVIAKIYTKGNGGKPGQLGVVVSAERLHNIKTSKGFTYGGKDDPIMLSLCQGDWPAPGEITSPLVKTPLVAGDCRGSHHLNLYPMPINSQTSYWSGPIISVVTLSINIHTGRIGAISDQLGQGTPWDTYRAQAAKKMAEFRSAQGYKQPGTLPTDEIEYQPGFNRRMAELNSRFVRKAT